MTHDRIKKELLKKLEDIDGYFEFDSEESMLDSYFTSLDLRRIADAMDEFAYLKKVYPEVL